MENTEVKMLSNAIDKFFFLLYDLQSYFSVLLKNKVYTNRIQIIDDIIQYKQTNLVPKKISGCVKTIEVFYDLVKRTDEWNYWKRLIVINFTKITISLYTYKNAEKNEPEYLKKLIGYVEEIFNRAMNA